MTPQICLHLKSRSLYIYVSLPDKNNIADEIKLRIMRGESNLNGPGGLTVFTRAFIRGSEEGKVSGRTCDDKQRVGGMKRRNQLPRTIEQILSSRVSRRA